MKKLNSVITVLGLVLAFGIGYWAKGPSDIATVNIRAVLESYPEIALLRRENAVKNSELSQWIDNAAKEVEKEKDKKKRAELAAQYKKKAVEKDMANKREYNKAAAAVNQKITQLINDVARKAGYKTVLSNTSVVTGGKDITQHVLDRIKAEKK